MSWIRKTLFIAGTVLTVLVVGLFVWLAVAPPELLRVGTGYAAKAVCSNVFIAHRDSKAVLAEDVQAPGNPILKLITVNVDNKAQTATATLLGFAAPQIAAFRPGLGCTSVPDGDVASLNDTAFNPLPATPIESLAEWPEGTGAPAADARLQAVLKDTGLTGPGMRAVVIIRDGKLMAETYAPGFSAQTPLLGWSMTKTINAALLGVLTGDGRIKLSDKNLFPDWTKDSRADITVVDLMSMSSGLEFKEDYGGVSDVSRMLYLETDMSGFVASKPFYSQTPKPGMAFHYSSGSSILLTSIWMRQFPNYQSSIHFPRETLFGPLGMTSAIFEVDESGTFAGSSYLYATARDWARFGQFLLQDGVWKDKRILPEGFVGLMRTSNGLKGGYSKAQTWLEGPGGPEANMGLPADVFWMRGYDGQSVAIVPSQKLVMVRMGLTPSKYDYQPEHLLKAVLAAD